MQESMEGKTITKLPDAAVQKLLSYDALCIEMGFGLRLLNSYLHELSLVASGVPYAELGIGERRRASAAGAQTFRERIPMRDLVAIVLTGCLFCASCAFPHRSQAIAEPTNQQQSESTRLSDQQIEQIPAARLLEEILLEDRTTRRTDYRRQMATAWCRRVGITNPDQVNRVLNHTFWVGCPTDVMLLTMGKPDRHSKNTSLGLHGQQVTEWFHYGSILDEGPRRTVYVVNGHVESISDDN